MKKIELRRLELLRKALDVPEVEVGVGVGAGVAPRAGVDGDQTHEGAEVELAVGAHRRILIPCLRSDQRAAAVHGERRPGDERVGGEKQDRSATSSPRPMHLPYAPDRRMTPKLRSFVELAAERFGR